jgi:hypothetical protein
MIVSYPCSHVRKTDVGYEQKHLSYDTDEPHNFTATWKEVPEAEIIQPAALLEPQEAQEKEADGVR